MPGGPIEAAALIPAIDGIPGPQGLLSALLYLTFVLHLLLMNAVLGVAAITLFSRFAPRLLPGSPAENPAGEAAAGQAGGSSGDISLHGPETLLPKGLALVVNFGVPPFLFIQALYGQFIYPSSTIMAFWWLSVMFVVMFAYYGLYLNMARHSLGRRQRTIALALAVALLCWNAFIFVNNLTLHEEPARWSVWAAEAGGTFLNFADPRVPPRYAHVLLACLAVGGLCFALPAHFAARKGKAHAARARAGLNWFFYATLAQAPVGAWYFLSLKPEHQALFMGKNVLCGALFVLSLFFAGTSLTMARRGRAPGAAVCLILVVFMMAGMRFILRAALLEPFQSPAMRAFDHSPAALFLVSLALLVPAVVWMLMLYYRKHSPPERGRAADAPDSAPAAPAYAGPSPEQERDGGLDAEALLINEIHTRRDASDSSERDADGPAGGGGRNSGKGGGE